MNLYMSLILCNGWVFCSSNIGGLVSFLGNGPSKLILLEGLDHSQGWDIPATPGLGRLRREDDWELEAKLDFLINSRPIWNKSGWDTDAKNKTKQTTKAKIKPKPNKVRTEPTNCCRLNLLFSSVFSKLLESTGNEAPRFRDRLTLVGCVKEILCHSPVSHCCSLYLDSQRSMCWSFDWQPVRVGLVEGSQVVGTMTLKPQPTTFLLLLLSFLLSLYSLLSVSPLFFLSPSLSPLPLPLSRPPYSD